MHKGGHAILYHVDQWMGGCCMGKGSGYGVDMHAWGRGRWDCERRGSRGEGRFRRAAIGQCTSKTGNVLSRGLVRRRDAGTGKAADRITVSGKHMVMRQEIAIMWTPPPRQSHQKKTINKTT